jgi:hypothetical protein
VHMQPLSLNESSGSSVRKPAGQEFSL